MKEEEDAAIARMEAGGTALAGEQAAEVRRLARDAAASMASSRGLRNPNDMNGFYLKVLPKLAEKACQGSGGKVVISTIDLKNGRSPIEVPTLELTDAVRDKLTNSLPLYSRAPLLSAPRDAYDPHLATLVRRCGDMLGSTKHVAFVARLYDTATGNRVAGRTVGKLMEIALDARDIDEVVNHEIFHYCEENLLLARERKLIAEQFAVGSSLHFQVQDLLVKRGDVALAMQCLDPKEAAAQGFAFWYAGQLDVGEPETKGIFGDLVDLIRDVIHWLRREALEHRCQTTEEVFAALSDGGLAERQADLDERYARAALHERS